ncbi:hypothetical protein BSKO_09916 [Bryopsis sp. KO-2023]|nr:hypothetical protein BSKO_09916 [Bryopsis sp. KO-2023]
MNGTGVSNQAQVDLVAVNKTLTSTETSSTVTANGATIDDLEEGILVRIFEHVLGEACHAWDSVFGRRFEDNCHMEPTCIEGFAHGLVLPQVSKRWERIVKSYSGLWDRVYVDTVADQEEGYDEICPLPSSVCLPWWVNHAQKLKSVHLKGNSAGSDGGLGMYNMGLLSLLSGPTLQILHLDDCFETGASDRIIPILKRFVNLAQLRLMRVDGSFIERISELCEIKSLKRLELQGMENGVVEMNTSGLPDSLEVLGLALVGIAGGLDAGRTPLTSLKILKLVHVDWQGSFCNHISRLTQLEGIVINNVFLAEHREALASWHQMGALESLRHLEVGGEHEPAFSQCAGERAIESLPFRDLTKLCLKFQSRSSAGFVNRHGQFSQLTRLYLECFDFGTIPESILELTHLEQLGLVDCELATFPRVADVWVNKLTLLDISKNRLVEFPKAVTRLTSLTDLNVAHNDSIVYKSVNCLADLSELLTLRLLDGERLMFEFDNPEALELRFRSKLEAYRMGSLFTMLQVKNPHCHLYL